MKNKIVYAFNLAKSCKNCERWHDTGKSKEVQAGTLPAVIFRLGRCTDGNYTTENYACEKFK